jgi:CubicO group peptidase (beta-lactamase class C family)
VSTDANWDGVRRVLEDAVAERAFPGASLLIGRGDDIATELQVGSLSEAEGSVTPDTSYDLSSLTKPLATLAALLILVSRGRVALDDPFACFYPEFADDGPPDEAERRRAVTIADVLGHRAGLKAVGAFARDLEVECPDQVGQVISGPTIAGYAARLPLEYPPKTREVYSDLGFIMLGVAIERLCGARLDEFVTAEFLQPLAAAAGYRPLPQSRVAPDLDLVAPCGSCSWRGGVVRGVVQDENAWAMGGIAGHAGLFGTARGVHSLIAEYVAASYGNGRILDSELVRRCWQPPHAASAGATWVLGWDTPTAGSSSAGRFVSQRSVGHLGFTGTSVWVDRVRGVHVILLTNRLHPDRDNVSIRRLRPRIHDAVFAAIDGDMVGTTTTT